MRITKATEILKVKPKNDERYSTSGNGTVYIMFRKKHLQTFVEEDLLYFSAASQDKLHDLYQAMHGDA